MAESVRIQALGFLVPLVIICRQVWIGPWQCRLCFPLPRLLKWPDRWEKKVSPALLPSTRWWGWVALDNYATSQAVLPPRDDLDAVDFEIYNDASSRADLAAASEIEPVRLNKRKLKDLMAFLHALTDRDSLDIRHTTPMSVPSGLPLAD